MAARQIIVQHYGFHSAITANDKLFNIECAAQLQVDHAFTRPVHPSLFVKNILLLTIWYGFY